MRLGTNKETPMKMKHALLGAAALLTLAAAGAAQAQPDWVPPGNDPRGYYSDFDHNGYYDRDGHYNHIRSDRDDRYGPPPPPPPPPGGAYYEQGRYESDCHRGNTTAGTIFGALAGAAIGAGVSHGNGGAAIGGAVLGGLLGNTISRDIDCDDQPMAFRVYAQGLNGDIGRRYEWRGRGGYGYFTPTRQFRRGGVVCRDFTETTYRGGRAYTRTGTACRETGGNWRFD
jgi:surface antigen